MKTFFYKFLENVLNCFRGYNLLWQVIAFVLSIVIVSSDFDWIYFKATRFIPRAVWIPAAAMGGLLPIILPLVLLLIAKIRKNKIAIIKAWGLGQAALMGYIISIFYKSLTGRIPPDVFSGNIDLDISKGWQFGFMRGGIFWGWPSSHTTVAFAMAVSLIIMYPKNKLIRLFALIYALYVGLAVSVSIHWLSEFVAGVIFGSLIGLIVGRAFREKVEESK